MSSNFKPIHRQETLGDHVLAQIRELLLSGKVMPGEVLSLRPTALALGVSMTPVREAVYQLVAERALLIAPNRSIKVPVLSAEEFCEVTRLRLLNEGYAVERAIKNVNRPLLKELRTLNRSLAEAMGQSAEDPDRDNSDIVALNKTLHFTLYEAAGMPLLTKVIEGCWLRIGPILNYDLRKGSERTREQHAVKFHDELIAALERGDATAAKTALFQDICSTFHYILQKEYQTSAKELGADDIPELGLIPPSSQEQRAASGDQQVPDE